MPSKIVAIELMPTRMDVVLLRGGVVLRSERIAIELDREPAQWTQGLRRASRLLGAAVERLDATGLPAVVLYDSPTASVDLNSVPVRSTAQAQEAAVLSCMDSLAYSFGAATFEAVVLGRDRGAERRQTHLVVAVERDDIAAAIADTVTAANLRFLSATPMDATTLVRLARRALRHTAGRQGWFHVGEHSSHFVVGGQGRLDFGRSLAMGLERMAESLTRPIRSRTHDGPIELDAAVARSIIVRHGIPKAKQLVHEALHLTGAQIRPLIQPLLQRCVVELRQSLRFGLTEQAREQVQILLTGPGACVGGLAELLAEELGVPVTADPAYAEYDHADIGGPGSELREALSDRSILQQLNLLPRELGVRRRVGALRRWLWTGAAAALVAVAADTVRYEWRLREARPQMEVLTREAQALDALDTTRTRLMSVISGMEALEDVVQEQLGAPVEPRAILHELSLITPESLRLTSLSLYRQDEAIGGEMFGYALAPRDGGSPTRLAPYIGRLKESPLFRDVTLRKVTTVELGSAAAERFQASFVVQPTPSLPQEAPAIVLEEEARP